MSETLVEIVRGKKSIEITRESYEQREGDDRLTFYFCSNGWQSTGVTISQEEIEMLESALEKLKKIGVPVTKFTR